MSEESKQGFPRLKRLHNFLWMSERERTEFIERSVKLLQTPILAKAQSIQDQNEKPSTQPQQDTDALRQQHDEAGRAHAANQPSILEGQNLHGTIFHRAPLVPGTGQQYHPGPLGQDGRPFPRGPLGHGGVPFRPPFQPPGH